MSEEQKHPLVVAVEAVLPKRPARFDDQRAYDNGVRDSIKALEAALKQHTVLPFGWVVRYTTMLNGKPTKMYVGGAPEWQDSLIGQCWTNCQTDAEIFPTSFAFVVIDKLRVLMPNETFEAVELFTAL